MSKKKTTGFVAGAAGVALLMGGATFALWNDSDTTDGGTITAGNLAVAVDGPSWSDVSADDPILIEDLNAFRIVPGDTIEGRFPIDVDLEGDNLTAELSFHADAVNGDLMGGLSNFQFSVEDANNVEVVKPGVDPNVTMELNEDADLTAVVTMTFDPDTHEDSRALTQTQLALNEAGVELKQVR